MSAPYSDIESKVEAVYAAAINAGVSSANRGVDARTGLSAADHDSGDRIICECLRTRGFKGVPGNFYATVTITVRTKCNPRPRTDFLTTHRSRVAYVRDFLMDDGLPATLCSSATLTAAGISDFTVQGIFSELVTESGREEVDPDPREQVRGDHFVSVMTQEIVCFASSS